jgi:hopene-associated glycosyltransferase HpnB
MILGIVVMAVWAYLLFGRGRFWLMRVERALPRGSGSSSVAAVVPARDEADVVGKAVGSLARQQYDGEFRIVLVDDGSSDGTAEIAKAAGADRLTVISGAPLAAGWTGKLWAVSQGVHEAGAVDYLLLTDADIVHGPGNVAELVGRAERGGFDLVSYMATLHCETTAERALIPAFVFFFFLLYPPAWGSGAAGGCILIRRTALERVGGIAAIRGELIDDCALAAAVRRCGGKVWLGLSRETVSIRAYETFAEIGRMISRSAFTQLRHSVWLLAGTVAGLALTYVAPPVLAIGGSWWGAAAWGMMSVAYFPALRYYRRSPLWAPLLPLVAIFYLGATVHSAVTYWRGRGGMWKGRVQDARS